MGATWTTLKKASYKCPPMIIYVNDNPMSIILSLKEMENLFRVKIDTKDDHAMISHFNKDKAYRFKECGNGLY